MRPPASAGTYVVAIFALGTVKPAIAICAAANVLIEQAPNRIAKALGDRNEDLLRLVPLLVLVR